MHDTPRRRDSRPPTRTAGATQLAETRQPSAHPDLSLCLPVIGAGSGGMGEERALAFMLMELETLEGDLEVVVVRHRP